MISRIEAQRLDNKLPDISPYAEWQEEVRLLEIRYRAIEQWLDEQSLRKAEKN